MTRHPVYSAEHDALRESVRRFVDKEIAPHVDEWEEAGHFPDDVFRRCGELGFLGLHYPERWGGSGGDLASGLVFVEELARCGCGAIPMAVSVQSHMATPALAEFGTDEQRARWLAPAIAGTQICAIAITEPDAGSDVAGLSTRAERTDDGWLLNGRKLYITNGVRADWMTLVARTEPGDRHGVSLFCVDTNLPGLGRTPLRKLGMRSSDTVEVTLDDVEVPALSLIGGEHGQGFQQLMWQLQYERMAAAAACIGSVAKVLEDTIAFARERRAFGRPISGFQVIAHGLADAATELEAVTALYDTVLWRLSTGEYPVAEVSMAKKLAVQVQNRLIDWCLQVHGGAGFMHEQPVSRAYRDVPQRIGGGTDQVMNEVIAKRLGITGLTRCPTDPTVHASEGGSCETASVASPDQVVMPTAAQLVADSIRRQIVTGELADGESLPPEAALIETYGVSRPTFREALRILQSESLISIRRGSRGGARVNAPMIEPIARHAGYVLQHQETTLQDVYEARRIVEPPAAAMLALTNKTTRRALREALEHEQAAAAADPVTYAHASAAFHEAVMRLAGNNTLSLFAGILHGIIDRHSEYVYRDERDVPGRRQRSDAAHTRLVELVEAGDAAAAEAHWREHLEEIGARMAKTKVLKRRVDLFG